MRATPNAETPKDGKRLETSFFQRADVTELAQEMIGTFIVSNMGGHRCSGMITETEAYDGQNDRACHAHAGRRTKRTEVMYEKGGTAYVYLCYGIHHLFNVISGPEEQPDAVLIRAIEAAEGKNTLLERRGMERPSRNWLGGPGKLTHGLSVRTERHDRTDLGSSEEIWIEERGIEVPKKAVHTGKRIGIDYAGPDAALPYRFYLTEKKGQELLYKHSRTPT